MPRTISAPTSRQLAGLMFLLKTAEKHVAEAQKMKHPHIGSMVKKVTLATAFLDQVATEMTTR